MTMREEFEAWALGQGLRPTRSSVAMMFANGRRVAIDGYILGEVECAWLAYQAARASAAADLRVAYYQGWAASSEGYNGEHPPMAYKSPEWETEREARLATVAGVTVLP
jgi:hypothetical protein